MKVSILIVTHNSYPDIKETIDSILVNLSGIDYEIIVVDNNSSEIDNVEYLKAQSVRGDIRFVPLGVNIGFGRANNLAFSLATSENILILNPDVAFDADSKSNILKLIKFLDNEEAIGAVSPSLIKPDGSIDCNYRLSINPFQLLFNRFKKIVHSKDLGGSERLASSRLNVSSLAGAFIVIKSQNYRLIGGFDKRYFMYFEDLDFSLRLKEYGLDLFVLTDLFFKHNVGSSSRKRPHSMIYHMYKSAVQFYFKWGVFTLVRDAFVFFMVIPFTVIESLVRLAKGNSNVSD